MNQPNPNPNANANPPTAAAIARMKEIFNDPSRSEDAIKCATKDEVQELMSDYSLTSKQITSEFRKMYKAEWIRKRRIQGILPWEWHIHFSTSHQSRRRSPFSDAFF